MTILSEVQRRHNGPLPQLCGGLLAAAEPVVNRFHNRTQRAKIREELQKVADNGSIGQLLQLVDEPSALRKDGTGFAAARRLYQAISLDIVRLQTIIEDRDQIAESAGRQVAAVAASVIGTLVLTVVILFAAGGI